MTGLGGGLGTVSCFCDPVPACGCWQACAAAPACWACSPAVAVLTCMHVWQGSMLHEHRLHMLSSRGREMGGGLLVLCLLVGSSQRGAVVSSLQPGRPPWAQKQAPCTCSPCTSSSAGRLCLPAWLRPLCPSQAFSRVTGGCGGGSLRCSDPVSVTAGCRAARSSSPGTR